MSGKNNYSVSENGKKFIERFEGEIMHVYDDGFGYPTAGVGHLLTAAERKAMPIGTKITQKQCDDWLTDDLGECEDAVNNVVTVPITQNQFDALCSLAFNIGIGGFKGSSVVRNLNARLFDAAADSFLRWNKAKGKVVAGLTRRRNAERQLFLTPDPKQVQTAATPLQTGEDTEVPAPPSTANSGDNLQSNITTAQPLSDNLVQTEATPVQTVAAEPQDTDAKLNKWSARYALIPGGIFTGGMSVLTWAKDSPAHLVATIFIVFGAIVTVYIVLEKTFKFFEKRGDLKMQLVREQQAHEVQMALISSAANKGQNTVALIKPPPAAMLPNSDAEVPA